MLVHHILVIALELVLDTPPDSPDPILWLLLFDCIIYCGKNLCEKPYTSRLGYLRELVLKPFQAKCQNERAYKPTLPFQIKLKPLELSYGLARVFETMGGLDHKSDGVIFTSSVAPYIHGTCSKMLKWKPSDENSVDFKILDVESGGGQGKPLITIGLWKGGRHHAEFGKLTLSDVDVEAFKKERDNLKESIVECR
jgi:mRNA guanylyltransferase